jgi:hypothetical protein
MNSFLVKPKKYFPNYLITVINFGESYLAKAILQP